MVLNFLNKWTTLHYSVEILYVVTGYEVSILQDGNDFEGPFFGKTIEEAFLKAQKEIIND